MAAKVIPFLSDANMTDADESKIKSKLDELLKVEWDKIESHHLTRAKPLADEDHDEALLVLAEEELDTREKLGLGNVLGAGWAVDQVLHELGVSVERDSLEYRRACRFWYEGWLMLHERHRAMLSGDALGPMPTLSVRPNTAVSVPEASLQEGPRISELMPRYIAEKAATGKASEWTIRDKVTKTLQEFIDVAGDLPVNKVERSTIVRFRDNLLRLPSHRSIRPEYRGRSVAELLRMDIPENDRIGANSVMQHIGRLSSFFAWCLAEKATTKLLSNPVVQVGIKVNEVPRKDLDSADIRKLFSSPQYLGDTIPKAYLWWLPLLGLFTGARLSELILLRVSDLVQQDGIWILQINGTKTKNASRRVAVHSELIKLGFIDYVEAVSRAGHERILFDATLGTRTPGAHASKRLGEMLDAAGISDASKVFHSTRHSANTGAALGQPNVMVVQAVIGHQKDKAGQTHRYFHNDRIPANVLQETVEAIRYDADLSHLQGRWERFVR